MKNDRNFVEFQGLKKSLNIFSDLRIVEHRRNIVDVPSHVRDIFPESSACNKVYL